MEIKKSQQDIKDKKGLQFLLGLLGIYSCYWSAGYLQQKILKQPYSFNNDTQSVIFDSPISLIWIQAVVAWFIGFFINKKRNEPSTILPSRKMVQCAILVTVSALSSILAIKITSFPIVMMIKSCSIIPVVFVGFFCSKVKDNALKLGADKIVTALFISIGILIYNFGGDKDSVNKATSVIGILLLIISVLADGFLPDVQAVIKSEFNPHPTEMFEHTNKWIALISILYALLAGQIFYLFEFAEKCPQTIMDLSIFAILGAIGQIFIYRMVKQFKQHIVPFVITTRKIFTVIISIIVYHHSTTTLQIVGIAIVFISVSYEYCAQIFNSKKQTSKNSAKIFSMDQHNLNDFITEETQSSKEKIQIE